MAVVRAGAAAHNAAPAHDKGASGYAFALASVIQLPAVVVQLSDPLERAPAGIRVRGRSLLHRRAVQVTPKRRARSLSTLGRAPRGGLKDSSLLK